MKLLRTLTLAMVAALAGAAAENPAPPPTTPPPSESPTTAPPATPATTQAPTTTTPVPTTTSPTPPTTTTNSPAPGANTTPSPGTTAPVIANETNTTVVRLYLDAKLNISDTVTSATTITKPSADTSVATPVNGESKDTVRVELYTSNTSTQLGTLNSAIPTTLEFKFNVDNAPAGTRPTVELASFRELTRLGALMFSNIDFAGSNVAIIAPKSLGYLKIVNTNAQDVALEHPEEKPNLAIEFKSNNFAQLPLLLYQREYNNTLKITDPQTLLGKTTELSDEEYANAKKNLENNTLLSFIGNCISADTNASDHHVVCMNSKRKGIRTLVDNMPTDDNSATSKTPISRAPSANPDATTVATATPTTSQSRDSANTTLTVIVVVISVVAAVLAFLVARRYFWSSSRSSRSPRLNERTVGLISKDESHTAPGKLSFISADDTLRPLRMEPQDVALTKSVGAGKLWIGDYQGRKVVIKRVEAESSDSYATKALISQAKSLATLSHPAIVSMVGVAWIQGTDFGVVAEFMEKGTLKAMLMDLDAELDLQSKLHMCLDVAQAMLYLHSNERNMFIKRLSSRKVLVNNAVECKVNLFECDSCSSKVELPEVFGAGMLAWEAPEVVLRSGVLNPRKMNIFSLGVLICEVMTRVSPYQSEIDEMGHTLADIELTKRIRRQEKLLPHENRREFTELPVAVRDLVERCLSYQPLLRPTAEEVVQILESAKGYSERFGSTTSL